MLTLAMVRCVTGKKVFITQAHAEDALVESWIKFDYATGHGPIAIYRCDDCGYYHFTSKGAVNATLAKYLANGKIKAEKTAKLWNDKLKKRY